MVRIKFLLAFFALLVCFGGAAGAYYLWEKFARPDRIVARHIDGTAPVSPERPDFGRRHLDAAVELLQQGELVSARDRLLYLMDYFPESPSVAEARRIVGEINLDLLISNIPIPGKGEHVVRRGEALVTIARRHETTIDYIMRANGKTTSLIFPNETLTVFPLHLRVVIDLERSALTVLDEETFFKEYEILERNLPPDLRGPLDTAISEKVAWHEDRPVNFTDENYLDCSKWIRTGRMGLFIRQASARRAEGAAAPTGVMVSRPDLEELFTILRVGAPVSLVN